MWRMPVGLWVVLVVFFFFFYIIWFGRGGFVRGGSGREQVV